MGQFEWLGKIPMTSTKSSSGKEYTPIISAKGEDQKYSTSAGGAREKSDPTYPFPPTGFKAYGVRGSQTGVGTVTVYTVPVGKQFLVVGGTLSNDGAAAATEIRLFAQDYGWFGGFLTTNAQNTALSLSYAIPILFDEGAVIQLTVNGTGNGLVNLYGYLLNKP